ncbi:pigment-dispersing hormone peptides-like [Hylaeus volcanicus]|uniref:pigment-dispersing hormone peptides-like n=1 Tax=Hylaeus volcanicus TaxID=313075 RepID=UPI0023B7B371|nr:pigment-dispersing hormone peptides-like [Hylaeus volcanicus]
MSVANRFQPPRAIPNAYKSIGRRRLSGHSELALPTESSLHLQYPSSNEESYLNRMSLTKRMIILIAMLGIAYEAFGAIEEAERNFFGFPYMYSRTLDDPLALARMLCPGRFYHSKRNSELINSLLGLPKNMNNAGK